jgi:dTDP-4-dehydrorhamnose reductase
LRELCAGASGFVHLAAAGETSWHGLASAIVEDLKCDCNDEDYPTKARRPRNSRLDLTRLQTIFGITPPSWHIALAPRTAGAGT